MNNVRKIGTKQWMMMALSLSLAASSLFIPLEERAPDGGNFSMAVNTADVNPQQETGLDRS